MNYRAFRQCAALLTILCCLLAPLSAFASPEDYNKNFPAALQPDQLYGETAIVIDADTGEILFQKNDGVRMYPASTTKIMTLLLGIESGIPLDTVVTIPAEAADVTSDSSLVPVYRGETMTFGDLLYGTMLKSGNDGANAIAVLVAGSIPAFVEKMNARAQEIGCTGTHYVNAHGLHDDNHYTTARDLALIAQTAMHNETFRKIVATQQYTMNISTRGAVTVSSTNNLINPNSSYYYADCIGIKTGMHSKAGKCMVGAAEKEGVTLITVSLHCGDDPQRFVDTIRLFDFGFTCYMPYTLEQMFGMTNTSLANVHIANASENDPYNGYLGLNIAQISDPSYVRMVQSGNSDSLESAKNDFVTRSSIALIDDLTAPISEGQIIGMFTYTTTDGQTITASVTAARSVEARPERLTLYDVFPFLRVFENPLVVLLVIVILLLVLAIILYSASRRHRLARRRKQLYERRRQEYLRRQAMEKRNCRPSSGKPSGSNRSRPPRRN